MTRILTMKNKAEIWKVESRNVNRLLALISIFCFLFSALAFATPSVTLAWNPPTGNYVAGYKIYAWTNSPDTNCFATNAIQTATVGNVTNATLNLLVAGNYTFAATAFSTYGTYTNESLFSNFAYWQVPFGPTYLITVQSSTNLTTWTNTQMFFRLQIAAP